MSVIDVAAVEKAAERLRGVVHRTPVFTSRTLNERCGCEVYVKAESFQRSGSFKFRGAYHMLSCLPAETRARGVVTYSSGNHAQALALAGQLTGTPVHVVTPPDAPRVKRAAAQGYGAQLVEFDPQREEREIIAERLAEEQKLYLVPPFDHPWIIAGQGTAALEWLDEGTPLDAVFVPCGGGGLLSGVAAAMKGRSPKTRIFGVEPDGADNGARAFAAQRLVRVEQPRTMADGLKPKSLGTHTLECILRWVDGMIRVREDELRESLRFIWQRLKLVVEPSGAAALAPLLRCPPEWAGKRVGVLLSGGNVDVTAIGRWLEQDLA